MRRWLVLLVLVACSDAVAPEEYAELVESSRRCAADGDCALAGGGLDVIGSCTCAVPVASASVDEINDAASRVECEGAVVECASNDNVRCEESRCVSDQNR